MIQKKRRKCDVKIGHYDRNIRPVFNVIRNQNVPSLEVQILQSQAQEIDLLKLFKTESELSTLTLMSDQGILENQYMNYSKLDTYNIQNDYIVKEAIGGLVSYCG